jgi:hypothetical protein
MRVEVFTAGKLSKKAGVSVAAAVIEGLAEGPVKVSAVCRPNRPTPSSVATHALWLGVGVALAKTEGQAVELVVYSSSKNTVKATDGTGGAKHETRLDAFEAGWVIYWTRQLAAAGGSWRIEHRAAAELTEAVEHATEALGRAQAEAAPEPDALALF